MDTKTKHIFVLWSSGRTKRRLFFAFPTDSGLETHFHVSEHCRKQFVFQVVLNLQDWTAYLDQQNFSFDSERLTDSNCFVMFETTNVEDEEDFLNRSFSIPSQRRVKVRINQFRRNVETSAEHFVLPTCFFGKEDKFQLVSESFSESTRKSVLSGC